MACKEEFVYCTKSENGKVSHGYFPLHCKSWDCPDCRQFKAKTVRAFVNQHFTNKTLYMLTFTFQHKLAPEFVWKNVGASWNRWRTRAVQMNGTFNFIKIVETHKVSPYPHFHVLIDRFIPLQLLTKLLTKQGFGWNFQSQRMSSDGASRYVAKYLTKEWPNEEGKKYRKEAKTRIVSSSRRLGPVFKSTTSWILVKKFWNKTVKDTWIEVKLRDLDKREWEFELTVLYFKGVVIETFIESENKVYDNCLMVNMLDCQS